jgi:hypothetical protein
LLRSSHAHVKRYKKGLLIPCQRLEAWPSSAAL